MYLFLVQLITSLICTVTSMLITVSSTVLYHVCSSSTMQNSMVKTTGPVEKWY